MIKALEVIYIFKIQKFKIIWVLKQNAVELFGFYIISSDNNMVFFNTYAGIFSFTGIVKENSVVPVVISSAITRGYEIQFTIPNKEYQYIGDYIYVYNHLLIIYIIANCTN